MGLDLGRRFNMTASALHKLCSFGRLTVVNNRFHIDRTRAIFNKVFSLAPLVCGAYELEFVAVDDVGLDADVLYSRREREKKSIQSFARNTAHLTSMRAFHLFLFSNHTAYASKRLLQERKPIDKAALKSY